MIVTETQSPPEQPLWIDHWERGLDPWHADAFKGTGVDIGTTGERAKGWYAVDWCGNVIGFVADGTEVKDEPPSVMASVVVAFVDAPNTCTEGDHEWDGEIMTIGREEGVTCSKCGMYFGHWAAFNLP